MPIVLDLGTYIQLFAWAMFLEGAWMVAWVWWALAVLAPWMKRRRSHAT